MNDSDLYLVYDGECPFCSRYVQLLRIRKAAGRVTLLNARESHPLVEQLIDRGYDMDDGMALVAGQQVYHGDRAINTLALLSSRVGWFNRINYLLFRSPLVARVSYPLLRAGRNALLRLLKREKINPA